MKTIKQTLFLIFLIALNAKALGQSTGNSVDKAKILTIISETPWIHVKSIDAITKDDVTNKFPQFAGIGMYHKDGTYEFFTTENKPKGDTGTWTLDSLNKKMKITSNTFGYTVEPELILVKKDHLDFKITIRDDSGKELGTVIAMHIPYR
jgi:Domain of unknown function (DUF4822)